jgi:hypothetical protein
MRKAVLFMLSAASVVAIASAGDGVVIQPPIRLDTAAELARLRATNPDHYARAAHVIAAANVLCPPAAPKLQDAELDRSDAVCELLLLRTSNPAKREITFRLDGIRYAALVAITADPPKPVRALEPSKGR